MHSSFILLVYSVLLFASGEYDGNPVKIPSSSIHTCPSNSTIRPAAIQHAIEAVNQYLNNNNGPPCKCASRSNWRRVAYLNMTKSTQTCPSNWTLLETPVRGCESRSTSRGCDSAYFPTGFSYNRVCGRVIGYQKGSPDAFDFTVGSANSIEEDYVDGLSLTHGLAGSRQHIWTFAAGAHEADPNYRTTFNCPCSNVNYNWTHQIPAFIGNNYFCDTGNPGPRFIRDFLYYCNPLWDGVGCAQSSTCCQFNQPPWFCASLPNFTSDLLELRICKDEQILNENIVVSFVEIYVALE